MNTIKVTNHWHKIARPEPSDYDLMVQIGCHLEEVGEMLDALDSISPHFKRVRTTLKRYAVTLKNGHSNMPQILNRRALLDSLADQIVTAVGIGHCAIMDVPTALERVNESNWTKIVDGKVIKATNGKIIKPEGYKPPDLEGLY